MRSIFTRFTSGLFPPAPAGAYYWPAVLLYVQLAVVHRPARSKHSLIRIQAVRCVVISPSMDIFKINAAVAGVIGVGVHSVFS